MFIKVEVEVKYSIKTGNADVYRPINSAVRRPRQAKIVTTLGGGGS